MHNHIQKPRVLVIGPYPPPFSGPEMAIKALLESPIRDSFEIDHLTTNVHRKNTFKGKLRLGLIAAFCSFISRLTTRLVRTRPSIVYYFVTATRLGWFGRDVWCIAVSRLFGAKVVIHMRAGHFKHNLTKAGRLEWAIIRWACHRTAWSLVQSESLRDQFVDLAPNNRIAVVHNMIDTDRYAAVHPADHDANCLLFLGHLTEAKGYCELLKAIATVASHHPNVVFYFAGTKLDRERNVHHVQTTGELLAGESPEECYDNYVANRCDANYRYLGVLDEEEKIAALRKCNFLILPSYSEGFSMAVLEALTIGKPVVCTAVGAMRDILESGVHGEVIEPGDTDALSSGILRLLDDPEYRNRTASLNARYARENFSQAVIARRLQALFESALE
jgi:glycosyltransferase involved in cell wall biosynthesis